MSRVPLLVAVLALLAVACSSGDATEEGHTPAVVLIHASGPDSRHAALPWQLAMPFGFTIPVFDELAQALAEAGWVVLTYDNRSCGTFNGCTVNAYPLPDDSLTTDTFAADAQRPRAARRGQCATHTLNCVTGSDPAKITAAIIGRTVDPTVPASLIEFLSAT